MKLDCDCGREPGKHTKLSSGVPIPEPSIERKPVRNAELLRRLREAEDLLRRGVAVLNRTGWEPGETDDEWRMAAHQWVSQQQLEREIFPEPKK